MSHTFTMENVPILFEDNHIIVVCKPQNLPTQADESGDIDLLSLIKDHVKTAANKPGEAFIGMVHRLDRPTGGLLVFAKNSKSAARLCAAITTDEVEKKYLTVLCGNLREKQGTLVSYLKKNPLTNTVYVATGGTIGAKRAELEYKVLQTVELTPQPKQSLATPDDFDNDYLGMEVPQKTLNLVSVKLETGRSHQIRVQFSSWNAPVYGDAKYGGDKFAGARGANLALWASELAFFHPVTKERLVFVSYPPQLEPWTRFEIEKHLEFYKRLEE